MLAGLARRGVARARSALALASAPGALRGAGQRQAGRRGRTRPAARCCSTSVCGAAGATTRSSSSSATRTRITPTRRRLRRRDRPLPRPPRRRAPPRRSAGGRPRPSATARRPPWHDSNSRCAGPAVGRPRVHVPRALGGPDAARPSQPLAQRAAPNATEQPRRRTPLPADATGDPVPAGRTQCRSCAPTRRSARRTRSRPTASAASLAPTCKAFGRARRLVYLEDQYLWSLDAAHALAGRRFGASPELHVVAVVPRYPDRDGRATEPRRRASDAQRVDRHPARAGGDRVAVYDLENADGHADLRPRQGLRRRRRVDGDRLRQPQPPLMDARLRDLVRGRSTPSATSVRRPTPPASETGRGARRDDPAAPVARAPGARRHRRRPGRSDRGLRRARTLGRGRSIAGTQAAVTVRDRPGTSACTANPTRQPAHPVVGTGRCTAVCSTPTADHGRWPAPEGSDRRFVGRAAHNSPTSASTVSAAPTISDG